MVRDQFQHRSAVEFGVPERRLRIFHTYTEAAEAVRDGIVDAYASVGRAHSGFIEQNPSWKVESVDVPHQEKAPAFGAFGLSLADRDLVARVNESLAEYLGSSEHRRMARTYGFSEADVNLVASN